MEDVDRVCIESYDNSHDRSMRLSRVLGFVVAKGVNLDKYITLYDHKGQLQVTSIDPLIPKRDREMFKLAWCLVGDYCDNVYFYSSSSGERI